LVLGELFDPQAPFAVCESIKPHWSQAGAIVFISIRAGDSLPQEVLRRWQRERCDWLRRIGVLGPHDENWQLATGRLSDKDQRQFRKHFNRLREMTLDECHGACLLRDQTLSQIVADSLLQFDGDRYKMGDFVVMPNHVHMLVAFQTAEAMRQQCTSWMKFTANRINRTIGRKGRYWQRDPFDHLVRTPEQYEYLRKYIQQNPSKSKLKPDEYFYRKYSGD
jgi:type I restriction enzyme R subunit